MDGYLARKNNQVTTFGKFADPLADKILILAALVILVELQKLPGWIPIVVLTREFMVSGYRLIAVEKGGKVIAASIWGKLKTITQMIAIILAFVDINSFGAFITESLAGFSLILNIAATIMMSVSVIATVFSGWDYLKRQQRIIYIGDYMIKYLLDMRIPKVNIAKELDISRGIVEKLLQRSVPNVQK